MENLSEIIKMVKEIAIGIGSCLISNSSIGNYYGNSLIYGDLNIIYYHSKGVYVSYGDKKVLSYDFGNKKNIYFVSGDWLITVTKLYGILLEEEAKISDINKQIKKGVQYI